MQTDYDPSSENIYVVVFFVVVVFYKERRTCALVYELNRVN